MNADLMLETVVHVAAREAARTGRMQIVARGPEAWYVRDAERGLAPGVGWVAWVRPGEDPMGICKRYYGRRHFAPASFAVVDPRVKPPAPPPPEPPKFFAPEPAPAREPGPSRQATLFD